MIQMILQGGKEQEAGWRQDFEKEKKIMWSAALLGFFYPESDKGLKLSTN